MNVTQLALVYTKTYVVPLDGPPYWYIRQSRLPAIAPSVHHIYPDVWAAIRDAVTMTEEYVWCPDLNIGHNTLFRGCGANPATSITVQRPQRVNTFFLMP